MMKTPFGILKRRRAAAAAVILCRFRGTPHEKRGFSAPTSSSSAALAREYCGTISSTMSPCSNLARLQQVSAVFRRYNVKFQPTGPA